jgi:putative membrane protein
MKNPATGGALAAVAILFVVSGNPAGAGELSDANILSIFDQANMADIQTARLGYKKGLSQDVKDLAMMVMTDHEAVQRMGRDIGSKLGLIAEPVDGDMALANHARAYGELQGLSGEAFDAAYLKHEIAFHTAVIDAINTVLLPEIDAPEFRELVVTVLPGFEHHLVETRRVAAELGVE